MKICPSITKGVHVRFWHKPHISKARKGIVLSGPSLTGMPKDRLRCPTWTYLRRVCVDYALCAAALLAKDHILPDPCCAAALQRVQPTSSTTYTSTSLTHTSNNNRPLLLRFSKLQHHLVYLANGQMPGFFFFSSGHGRW